MSEYWKSTPKYWCKHCSVYVRDTKLERANHESTAKHQSALKRSLRDLHRGHEREEREKERARREVERLNNVVSGSGSGSSSAPTFSSRNAVGSGASVATVAERKRQMEQLAELGISIPTEHRGDMAMPGEWTVTSTRVINHETENEHKQEVIEARAIGVRKRDKTEDEQEEEEAVRSLFKRPRKWGRDTKIIPNGDDKDLDALLSGTALPPKKEEVAEQVKMEEASDKIKKEEDADDTPQTAGDNGDINIKQEEAEDGTGDLYPTGKVAGAVEADGEGPAPVVFKKRKPKNIRQK